MEVVKIADRILSPTAINTYLYCPRKFYLRYIKKLRTRPSIHLIKGQIVHQTLHQFNKNNPQIPTTTPIGKIRTDLLNIFNKLWENAKGRLDALNLTPEQIDFYRNDSERMIFNYSHWFYKHGYPSPDMTEARFFSKNLKLMGIVDAVYEKPSKTILVDYKTSKNPELTEDINRQAALYALLYMDKYQKLPEAVWIHFLKEVDNPRLIHVDEHLLDYAKILLESIREKTKGYDEQSYPCTCGGYCERDFV